MGDTTVRIKDETHAILRELADAEGRPMQAILEEAVEAFRRRRFIEAVNRGYAALRTDAASWASVEAEREAWDATLEDGLAVHEPRPPGRARPKTKRARR